MSASTREHNRAEMEACTMKRFCRERDKRISSLASIENYPSFPWNSLLEKPLITFRIPPESPPELNLR